MFLNTKGEYKLLLWAQGNLRKYHGSSSWSLSKLALVTFLSEQEEYHTPVRCILCFSAGIYQYMTSLETYPSLQEPIVEEES
jgi:hypothetical protein